MLAWRGKRRGRRIAGVAGVALLALLLVWNAFRPHAAPVPVVVGRIEQFPPGSVTKIDLAITFNDTMRSPVPMVDLFALPLGQRVWEGTKNAWQRWFRPTVGQRTPVPVFIVNDAQQGVLALYDRDTHSSCAVVWQQLRFIDPCHGSHYAFTGDYVRGPAPRGLDRFGVAVNEGGDVLVDVAQFTQGTRAP